MCRIQTHKQLYETVNETKMFLFDIFIARQHAMCAQHDVVLANPSVCPSRAVCPSHTGIVGYLKTALFPAMIATRREYFLSAKTVIKFQGNSLSESVNIQGYGENLLFSTEIAVCLGNGTR